ncbi:MAG: hypothetical protein J0I04_02415 [Paenarthrobacter ureafaciens]|uniref:hypothetical protein n=1 Tax=Paenarthrobacter ureafaciens TaxID=37931 RepID=UPI001AC2A506|nr:hypothetical protein [Paenarthrobacter ureafaciens]MBN9128492.1 hypothetical protein [Paenarthrobacter ureafaciens]
MSNSPVPFKLVTSGNEILAFLTKAPKWATDSDAGNVVADGMVKCFHSEMINETPLCSVWVEQEDQYRVSDGTVIQGAPFARVGHLAGEYVDAADLRKAAAALLNAADLLDSLQQ